MLTRQNQNSLSPSVSQHLDGLTAPGGANYAGHSQHCECKEIAIQFERAYAERTRKMALLERVARAAEKHIHTDGIKECPICIYLRELNG